MLEGAAIHLRGDFQADVPVHAISRPRAEAEAFVADTAEGPLRLELGQREAALWVQKLLHPPSLLDKLGVGAGTAVHVDRKHEVVLAALEGSGALFVGPEHARLLFVVIEAAKDLARLAALAARRPEGALIWVLRRKGKEAPVRESEIMDAAKAAGLSPTKTAAWSEVWAADRYGQRAKR